ncbi:large ribosomal subunit protein eL20z [Physcomitrium patens]|uniref:60S ribosomal protein L18a-like protein n=1 Tax=Physcomitrium patens TaxID=3218 RepID=A0A2K1J1U6_PHYPA|nr:60S ribosomal protein L18a-like protein [Physcomitrium patens]PNR35498.1 hypothetical protein PHYPA_023398 [Physcomitrium patens]|eukprot:XP_024402912.1 60S ribosomal protein L18a-like protein [Physcomitrella patens]
MGFEKGATYGTFDGSQSFPQSSAPLLPGTFGSGGHVQYPVVPGYPVLENYPGSGQGSGCYQPAQYPVPQPVQTCYYECHEVICHQRALPFCGLGFGWFLFIMGFFIAVFPWYIGAVIFLFVRHDARERTGLLACTIAALVLLFVGGVGFHVHMQHH